MNFSSFTLFLVALVSLEPHFQLISAAKCVYYGSPGESGSQTANGEYFNPMGMTASTLPHLPFGTVLQVINMQTGRSINVRVNDRFGSRPREDTIDLTYGAFGLLANHNQGVFPCAYNVL